MTTLDLDTPLLPITPEHLKPELQGVAQIAGESAVNVSVEMPSDFDAYRAKVDEIITPLKSEAKLLDKYKLTPAELEGSMHNANAMLPHARVAMRRSFRTFTKLIEGDGKFTTYRNTGSSVGQGNVSSNRDYDSFRNKREEVYKIGSNDPDVTYGFLDYDNELESRARANTYGSVEFIFNKEVAERSTFTDQDSLRYVGAPMRNLEDAVVIDQIEETARQKTGNRTATEGYFMEAQVMGGLELTDVEKVVLTVDDKADAIEYSGQATSIEGTFSDKLQGIIDKTHTAMPGSDIIIRIDARSPVNRDLTKLALENQKVKFVLSLQASSPYIEEQFENHTTGSVGSQERANHSAKFVRGKAQERFEELKVKLLQRAVDSGRSDIPPNIVFATTDRVK